MVEARMVGVGRVRGCGLEDGRSDGTIGFQLESEGIFLRAIIEFTRWIMSWVAKISLDRSWEQGKREQRQESAG